MRRLLGGFLAGVILVSCGASTGPDNQTSADPDWKVFRSVAADDDVFDGVSGYRPSEGRFTFRDLKNESDVSLAHRLLGAVASRIVYIDRHKSRWRYYTHDDDTVDVITLFSKPESWGSAFGVCRSEKYEVSFADSGAISSVTVTPHYGVEGPIFQKRDFDWDDFRGRMCEDVPANHTPSYFPAGDVLEAQDLAILLSKAIDLAGRRGPLPFEMTCSNVDGQQCGPEARDFLAQLRLDEIDETSLINCDFAQKPAEDCYTVTVGDGRLGPFPKKITVRGSTYMNEWKVYSVSILESFTLS